MKALLRKTSARFLISLLSLGFLSTAFSFYAFRSYRNHYVSLLRSTEDFSRRLVSAHQDLLNQKISTRVRSLRRLADLGFAADAVASENLEASDWLWVKAPLFSWTSAKLGSDFQSGAVTGTQIGKNELRTTLDPDRKRIVFQMSYSDSTNLKNAPPHVVEAALDLSSALDPESSAAYRVGVFFVSPDGVIYPIGGDRGLLENASTAKKSRKLAELEKSGPDQWRETKRISRLPLRADTTLLGAVHVEGLKGQLMVGSRSSADAGYGLILLAGAFLASVWFLFFNERLWRLLPKRLELWVKPEATGPMRLTFEGQSLKFVPATADPEGDRLREGFVENFLQADRADGMKAWDREEFTISSQVSADVFSQDSGNSLAGAGISAPPTALPKLYLQKKAQERKYQTFEIDLNIEERQTFLRRMSVEVAEIQDLGGLATFFSKTFTRLLGGAPAAFFAVDTKDGRVQLLSRNPEDLFSRVIPAAFLPLDSEDAFEVAAARYLKDVAILSSDLIAQGTEWSIFGLGAGHRKAGFWAFPLRLGVETRFFTRMLCEIFLGHYLFLKSEEIEKRKTFFQKELLFDRLQEEVLQNTRLRHPFSLAVIETKLSDTEKEALDSMIFGAKADETLKVGAYLREKVRRSDRVYTLQENQIAIFFPHTAVLDLLSKMERVITEWNSQAPNTHGLRAMMIEFPTHGDSIQALDSVMKQSFQTLRKAPAGQILMATATAGYLPPFKSRFIRSAIIPGSPQQ